MSSMYEIAQVVDQDYHDKPRSNLTGVWEKNIKGSALLGAFNIICCVVGVGLLGLPYAISKSGWIGIPLLIGTCFMATYTAALLGTTLRASPGATSFADLGELAFGKWGRHMVTVQQYGTMLGVASIFLIVMASCFKQVFPETFPHCSRNITLSTILVSFHVFFYRLSEVGLLSAFNLLCAISLTAVVCMEASSNQITNAHTRWFNMDRHGPNNYDFLVAFPTIAFAFGCHTILPAIYEDLSYPSQFGPMVWCSMPMSLTMYLPVAVLGYWAFGEQVENPIFKNFDSAAINTVVLLLLIHVTMSYAIIMNPPELALEHFVVDGVARMRDQKLKRCMHYNKWAIRMILRLSLTGLTLVIAHTVPCFDNLLSLVSSVTGTTTSFIFPAVFYLRIVKNVSSWDRMMCLIIIGFSTLGGLAGLYNAILDLGKCQMNAEPC